MDFSLWDRVTSVLLISIVAAAACSKSLSTQPTTGLQVTSISPVVGSTGGGTTVTIMGNEFASDAAVTIEGIPAAKVVFQSPTTLLATTAAGPAGTGDVVVTSGGHTATLSKAFGYVAPTGANRPPVITGIRSIGSRPGEPAGFADQDETVTLVADATDAETPVSALTFLWTGPGTFGGTTATTSWHLPATVSPTPSPVTVSVTAVETFVEGKLTHTQTSDPKTFVLQVHDSQKEILDMGQDFLTLFSNSSVSTTDVLHNFSTTCDGGQGRADEKIDVDNNRALYVQDFSAFKISRRGPAVINFHSACVLPDGRVQANVDACASYAVHWEVNKKSTGARQITNGVDYVSAALENNTWRLCHSSFIASSGYPSLGIR
ncbi:MAG TPA: IPT/TIG domain-containing protein [Vicinamibacterales bacterium]